MLIFERIIKKPTLSKLEIQALFNGIKHEHLTTEHLNISYKVDYLS